MSITRGQSPASAAVRVLWPTEQTCGSVKMTRGASVPSAPWLAAVSLPSTWSQAIAAWYFAMCVNAARPLRSPIA